MWRVECSVNKWEEMNDLMDDLDRERKKRAEMEIDIDRLRRIRDKH